MDAGAWWDEVGSDVMYEVCHAIETSPEYFKHIARGRKRPSPQFAAKLAEESLRISGVGITVDSLLRIDHLPVSLIVGNRAGTV